MCSRGSTATFGGTWVSFNPVMGLEDRQSRTLCEPGFLREPIPLSKQASKQEIHATSMKGILLYPTVMVLIWKSCSSRGRKWRWYPRNLYYVNKSADVLEVTHVQRYPNAYFEETSIESITPLQSPITNGGPMWPRGLASPLCPDEGERERERESCAPEPAFGVFQA